MAHAVETMAYTNEVPWHGLGQYIEKAPDVDTMLKVAGLDWTVDREPIFVKVGKKTVEVEGFAALKRNTDDKVLDIVGSRWQPTQNVDVFEFFREFVEEGGATMETAGSLKGGRLVWGLASLNSKFKLRNNDLVKGYLLAVAPHEHGKSLVYKFTSVRAVCNNTVTLALREKGQPEFRMTHRTIFDAEAMTEAKKALGIAREQLDEFEDNAKRLQKTKMTEKDAIRVLAGEFQRNLGNGKDQVTIDRLLSDFDGLAMPTLKTVMHAYEHAPGAQPGNAWGVLNAATYYVDHLASRTADKRLEKAWLGKGAGQKERVLAELLDLSA